MTALNPCVKPRVAVNSDGCLKRRGLLGERTTPRKPSAARIYDNCDGAARGENDKAPLLHLFPLGACAEKQRRSPLRTCTLNCR
jgi:hypothetical protein